jgi:hypothetical protein
MQKTTSIKMAKQLKEAGYSGECDCVWQKYTQYEWKLSRCSDFDGINNKGQKEIDGREHITVFINDTDDACFSPDIPELLEELPARTNIVKGEDGSYYVSIMVGLDDDNEIIFKDKNLSDALAKLWISINKKYWI